MLNIQPHLNSSAMKYWKFKLISILIIALSLYTWIKIKTTWLDDNPKPKKHEAYYIEKLTHQLHGRSEVTIKGGRIDILTDTHAIEVEWAPKWKQSIGQALWYAMQKNTKPRIILLLKKETDYDYFLMLNSALHYSNIEIETQFIKLYKVKDDEDELSIE